MAWRLSQRDFYQTHGTSLTDAMIAASANSTGAASVTLNKGHFPMLRDVVVPYRKG
jgi:hypothetical protein